MTWCAVRPAQARSATAPWPAWSSALPRPQATTRPASGAFPARRLPHLRRAGRGQSLPAQDVSRHRSTDVLAAYVREAGLFTDHAGETFL
ncbi:hypothetical protein RAA17_25890 [Komagataeibacter rhaeticus]|nr:hypothetical protein [Komagataeibacter rhaeticus]